MSDNPETIFIIGPPGDQPITVHVHESSPDGTIKITEEETGATAQTESQETTIRKENGLSQLKEVESAKIDGNLCGAKTELTPDFDAIAKNLRNGSADLYLARNQQGRLLGYGIVTGGYQVDILRTDQNLGERAMQISRLILGQMKKDVGKGLYIPNVGFSDQEKRFLVENGFTDQSFEFTFNS